MSIRLTIKTLGGLSLQLGDEPAPKLASRKAEALLVYLAITGRPHPREVLADFLWDDRTQRQALSNLRVVLSSLRKQVGPFVTITRATAAINAEADIWLDALQLEAAAEVRDSLNAGTAMTLADALTHYDGDFLAGFFLREAGPFESWAASQREHLHRLASEGLARLAQYQLEHGAHAVAATWATRLVAIDPLAEGGHRQLMAALATSGRRTEALRQYESCRQLLSDELGIPPAPATDELFEAIRSGTYRPPAAQKPVVTTEVARVREEELTAGQTRFRHNLPTQLTPFIGRERELSQLAKLLAESRLVTIIGPGGMGKTRLALAAAAGELAIKGAGGSRCKHGIFWVTLAELDQVDHIVSAVAEILGLKLQGQGARSPRQQVLDYLARQQFLLLFDNFEHLLAGSALISDILRAAPQVVILATSRVRLGLRGEQLFHLAGLEMTQADPDRGLSPAGELFLRAARRLQPGFELNNGDTTALVEVCRLVGGMPLALELAAGWVDVLPLADIAAEIQRDLDFLETELGSVPDRHQSMRAVFDAAWARLTEAEQDLFAGLSVFHGGFTRQAAQAVTGASLRMVARLVGKSLLTYERGSDRYRAHPLLGRYALEKLAIDEAREGATRDNHCTYFCDFLEESQSRMSGPNELASVQQLEAEFENCRAAWNHAVDAGHRQLLAVALDSLGQFLEVWRSRPGEGERLFKRAATSLSANGPVEEIQLLVRVLSWQAGFAWSSGRHAEADRLCREALTLLSRSSVLAPDEWPGIASVLSRLARAISGIDDERELLRQSLMLARQSGEPQAEAGVLFRQARDALYRLDLAESRRLYENCLALFRSMGSNMAAGATLWRLAQVAVFESRFGEAERLAQEAADIFREYGDLPGVCVSLLTLGASMRLAGHYELSLSPTQEALETSREESINYYAVDAAVSLSDSHMHLGQYHEARALADWALKLAQKYDMAQPRSIALAKMGDMALATANFGQACEWFERCIELARPLGRLMDLSYALCHSSIALAGLGQTAVAQRRLAESLTILGQTHTWLITHTRVTGALIFLRCGEIERAIEWYAAATCFPRVANSRFFANIAGDKIAEAAARLSAEAVSAAEKRGRDDDLITTASALLTEFNQLDMKTS